MKKTTSYTATFAALALALATLGAPAGAQSGTSGTQGGSQDSSGMQQSGSQGTSGQSGTSGQMNQSNPSGSSTSSSSSMTNQKDAQTVINAWPDATKTAAQSLISKYGQPDTVTEKKLAWHDKDQWAMVAVYRDQVQSTTPSPHKAFISNGVELKVPEAKVAELQRFDRGLVIDQLDGFVVSNGPSEAANTLTLNLVNDIITGKKSVASAKTFYRDTMMKSVAGKSSSYMDSLQFTPKSSSSSGSNIDNSVPSSEQSSPSGSESVPSGGSQSPSGSDQSSPSGTQSSPSGSQSNPSGY